MTLDVWPDTLFALLANWDDFLAARFFADIGTGLLIGTSSTGTAASFVEDRVTRRCIIVLDERKITRLADS